MTQKRENGERWRMGHFEQHVITTRMPGGRPKTRELWIPDDTARNAHLEMLGYFYDNQLVDTSGLRPETYVDGAMPGSRVLDNVLPHKDGELFYMVDIKNAFRNVVYWVMEEKLVAHDPENARELRHFLDQYGMLPLMGLPQGAPCSPYLFNLYLEEMDYELDAFCAEQGITYTRWLDDLTFSFPFSSGALGKKGRQTINDIIEETRGMKVNHAKSRVHRLSTAPVTITGVSIYPEGEIEAAPHILRAARSAFRALGQMVLDDEFITPDHLAVSNGFYGAITSMSLEPFSSRVQRLLDLYHDMASLAHSTMALQDQVMSYLPADYPPWTTPEQFREYASFSDDVRIEQNRFAAHRRLEELLLLDDRATGGFVRRKAEDMHDQFPDADLAIAFGLALFYDPIYQEASGQVPQRYVGTEEEIEARRILMRWNKASRKVIDTSAMPLFDDDTLRNLPPSPR